LKINLNIVNHYVISPQHPYLHFVSCILFTNKDLFKHMPIILMYCHCVFRWSCTSCYRVWFPWRHIVWAQLVTVWCGIISIKYQSKHVSLLGNWLIGLMVCIQLAILKNYILMIDYYTLWDHVKHTFSVQRRTECHLVIINSFTKQTPVIYWKIVLLYIYNGHKISYFCLKFVFRKVHKLCIVCVYCWTATAAPIS
jgi:hypothetical protein